MRGLLGYLSKSSLSRGIALVNSFLARRSAPLSAMRRYCNVTSVGDPLQLEFGRGSGSGVRVFFDAVAERLPRLGDVARFDIGQCQLEHRIGGLVLPRKLVDHPLVETHRIRVVARRVIRLADPEKRVVREVSRRIGIVDLLKRRSRLGLLPLSNEHQRFLIRVSDISVVEHSRPRLCTWCWNRSWRWRGLDSRGWLSSTFQL